MTRPGPQPNEYLLGHSANEEERLRRQPQELAPDSRRLLDQLDIRPGDRAIDIGCGPQGILDLLSERVGARGRGVGLERSESTIHLARQFIAEHDLRNIEVLQRHLDDPGALVISHLFLQVWGRKPGKTCVPEWSA